MNKKTGLALATGALIGSMALASAPAFADDWRDHGRYRSDYYRHDDHRWRERGYDYRRTTTSRRCAWNGCAVYRCDYSGGNCVRIGPWEPR